MEFEEVVRTTFAAREFLDEAIPEDALYRILDHARFAPSGGNRQGWRVIAVADPTTRRRLAAIIDPVFRLYAAQAQAGENPWNPIVPSRVGAEEAARVEASYPIVDAIETLPAVLVVALDLRVVAAFDRDLDRVGVIGGASIYPFAWNVLLAARNEGYAGVLTTFLAAGEPEAQQALGIPDHYAVAGMIALGRPVKQLTRLRRNPVESFATWDRFDGPALTSAAAGEGSTS